MVLLYIHWQCYSNQSAELNVKQIWLKAHHTISRAIYSDSIKRSFNKSNNNKFNKKPLKSKTCVKINIFFFMKSMPADTEHSNQIYIWKIQTLLSCLKQIWRKNNNKNYKKTTKKQHQQRLTIKNNLYYFSIQFLN